MSWPSTQFRAELAQAERDADDFVLSAILDQRSSRKSPGRHARGPHPPKGLAFGLSDSGFFFLAKTEEVEGPQRLQSLGSSYLTPRRVGYFASGDARQKLDPIACPASVRILVAAHPPPFDFYDYSAHPRRGAPALWLEMEAFELRKSPHRASGPEAIWTLPLRQSPPSMARAELGGRRWREALAGGLRPAADGAPACADSVVLVGMGARFFFFFLR